MLILLEKIGSIFKSLSISQEIITAPKIAKSLGMNPILVTALNREIGYEKAAHIAKKAYKENKSIINVAHEETGLSKAKLKVLLDPAKLTKGGV